jgi:hypothetical protein
MVKCGTLNAKSVGVVVIEAVVVVVVVVVVEAVVVEWVVGEAVEEDEGVGIVRVL